MLFLYATTSIAADETTQPFFVSVGVAHLRAAKAGARIVTRVTPSAGTLALGIPESFESPGVDLSPEPVTTPALSFGYRATDHFAIVAELGIPPEVTVEGAGVVAAPGLSGAVFQLDLSDPSLNPLGRQRQWSPVVGLQYAFGPPQKSLRPFLGAGLTYTWFTRERLNPAFVRAIDERFGQPLAISAGKPGPTTAQIEVRPLWAWTVGGGARYPLNERWGLTATVAYAPLDVRSVLTLRAEDGSTLARSRARLSADGVIAAASLQYRF